VVRSADFAAFKAPIDLLHHLKILRKLITDEFAWHNPAVDTKVLRDVRDISSPCLGESDDPHASKCDDEFGVVFFNPVPLVSVPCVDCAPNCLCLGEFCLVFDRFRTKLDSEVGGFVGQSINVILHGCSSLAFRWGNGQIVLQISSV
jgi:hypothetical protein